MRPGIDEELDKKKHVYHGIDSILVSRDWGTRRFSQQAKDEETSSRMLHIKFRGRFQGTWQCHSMLFTSHSWVRIFFDLLNSWHVLIQKGG